MSPSASGTSRVFHHSSSGAVVLSLSQRASFCPTNFGAGQCSPHRPQLPVTQTVHSRIEQQTNFRTQ